MNKIEKQVLFHLYHNKRNSVNKIARDLKLSRTQVEYALHCFFTKKYVRQFYPIFNYESLGYSFYIFVLIRIFDKSKTTFIENELKLQKNCLSCGNCQGKYDLFANFRFQSKKDFLKWKQQSELEKYAFIDFITPDKLEFYDLKCFNKEENIKFDLLAKDKIKLDSLDRSVIKALSQDPLASATKIAKSINAPIRTVTNRIRALQRDKVFLGLRALLNFRNLGFSLTGTFIYVNENINLSKFLAIVRHHPFTNACLIPTSQAYIYVQFFHTDMNQLKDCIAELKKKFSQNILRFEILLLDEETSINACPFY